MSSSSGTCKHFVRAFCRVRRWPIDSSRAYRCSVPPRRAKRRGWKAAHPKEAPAASLHAGQEQILCYISLLGRTCIHLLPFFFFLPFFLFVIFLFSELMFFRLQEHFPKMDFSIEKGATREGPLHMVKAWGLGRFILN